MSEVSAAALSAANSAAAALTSPTIASAAIAFDIALLLLFAAAATPRAAHELEGGARLEVANQLSFISLTLTFWGLLCTYLLSPKLCLKYKSGCLPTTRQPYNK